MNVSPVSGPIRPTRVRWFIVTMLFIMTIINFADRAALSIAGPAAAKELGLDAVSIGFVFSAFGWAYVLGQIPSGWLLDRFGSRHVYFISILSWSIFTLLQGFVGLPGAGPAFAGLFVLQFLVGLAEAPSFPGNGRIVAAWFPASERGTAVSIFNSSQYLATVFFVPMMGWIAHAFGWEHVFIVMGLIGIVLAFVWLKVVHAPIEHPRINQAELDYIIQGGALVSMDQPAAGTARLPVRWCIGQLLQSRMLLGIYIGQYCITTLTYFFLTWFPVYLVQARGMPVLKAGFIAVMPAMSGFIGGMAGGVFSDWLLKKGCSLTVARKMPIVTGMLLSLSMMGCNWTDTEWAVVALMSLAYFGVGFGALGWALVSDTSPGEIAGLSGALMNTFGNIAGIVTPIIIGYIIQGTGSFDGALVFVGLNALGAILAFLLVVGEIRRLELKPPR